ncbi:MAG: hypothetical protein ABII12_05630 [Planctomycetota bacterium]
MMPSRTLSLTIAVVCTALLQPACTQSWDWSQSQAQNKGPGPRMDDPGMESNIVRVNKFFGANPWLTFKSDGSSAVDGVRCTVYLEGAAQPKGVFGNGAILVDMYELAQDADGKEQPCQAHQWRLGPEEAYAWRAKKETYMGWAYSLRLNWPDHLDVAGRQVAFVVRYVRDDGRVVSSSRQVLRVPAVSSRGQPKVATRKVREPGGERAADRENEDDSASSFLDR